jgi:hypothetical protein
VSSIVSHLDFPRVISQANGTPARRSKAATIKAILNELEIAPKAVFINAGWLVMLPIVGTFIKMPSMGGMRIIAKKMIIAER